MRISIGLKQTLGDGGATLLVAGLGGQSLLEMRSILEQFRYSHLTYSGLDGPQDFNGPANVIPGFPNYLCESNQS
jgi:hypothetical protein